METLVDIKEDQLANKIREEYCTLDEAKDDHKIVISILLLLA